MDDRNFDDPKTALEWIEGIESDRANIREADLYPFLRDWIKQASPKKILDIGSGQGICSDKIELNGREYTGLEPSSIMVERARNLYPLSNRNFVLGNIYKMPFADGTFDATFSVSVWHLLSDLTKASQELSRILKNGGHFLIVTANPDAYSLWTSLYSDTTLNGSRLEGIVRRDGKVISQDTLYLHTIDEILSALRKSGLDISQIQTFRPTSSGQYQYLSIHGKKSTNSH